MLSRQSLAKIRENIYEIQSYRADMLVPARVFADEEILEKTLTDRSLEQLVNVATLPGIVGYALGMPDIHEGYGFPVGGVAATLAPDGIISPGGIGYDINCGVRLLRTPFSYDELRRALPAIATALFNHVPSGVGRGGKYKLKKKRIGGGFGERAQLGRTERLCTAEGCGIHRKQRAS